MRKITYKMLQQLIVTKTSEFVRDTNLIRIVKDYSGENISQ